MSAATPCEHLFTQRGAAALETVRVAGGVACVFCAPRPGAAPHNEDGAAVLALNDRAAVLAVADGFGGQPAGERASELALETLIAEVRAIVDAGGEVRAGVLNGFEQANRRIAELGVGAATTLAVVVIEDDRARAMHAGDSGVLIVGQRGRVKFQAIAHSPVGYAVEAGVIEEDEALLHEERHVVSNMLGSDEMRIDVGPHVALRVYDTVLIASDGLFDNLPTREIIERIRRGPLERGVEMLADECRQRMSGAAPETASKPDDLTVVAFRRDRR
ncbi:MAG: protein serine/threonine phosphatase 2C family protein [Planctomycetota bacterium]|nr:MAG: protein serine/threonine phosphatase 2C family protein [Planctomycetota bacterium]